MALQVIYGDIVEQKVDAIVNAANTGLRGGGGVDGAIHRAAGAKQLHEACKKIGGCPTGQARITPGFALPAKYIIHTVGPIWHGGSKGERGLLASAYRSSLELAVENDCHSIAFPLLSAGVYGYPKAEAIAVAKETINDFLKDHDLDVYLVLFGQPK